MTGSERLSFRTPQLQRFCPRSVITATTRKYYKPTVVDSRLLSGSGACEQLSMRVVNKEVVAQTALDMEYETCYFRVDGTRWHSITRSRRVQEIRHYGQADEHEFLPIVAVVISGAFQRCQV